MKTKEEVEMLVEENIKLVNFTINKYFKPFTGILNGLGMYEDFYQQGCIGLFKAATIFNPDKGFKFSTIAGKCIFHELCKFQTRDFEKRYKLDADSLDRNICNDGEDEITIAIPIIEDGYDLIGINELISKLSDKERLILELSKNGYSQREIGDKLGVTQVEASRRLKRIRIKLNNLENGVAAKYERIEDYDELGRYVNELKSKGLRYKEIAEILNMNISTLRYRLNKIA